MYTIIITHEVAFPDSGEYTGLIMQWAAENDIGYRFSKGQYVMKLTDAEWVKFIDDMLSWGEYEIELN